MLSIAKHFLLILELDAFTDTGIFNVPLLIFLRLP